MIWPDPRGLDHGCIQPGCDRFGGFGRKRKGATGSCGYDWFCRAHRPHAATVEVASPRPLDKGGQGRLGL